MFRGAPKLSEYACGPATGQYENGWSSVTGPPPLLGIETFCAARAARSAASRACLASAAPSALTKFEIFVRRLARFDRSDRLLLGELAVQHGLTRPERGELLLLAGAQHGQAVLLHLQAVGHRLSLLGQADVLGVDRAHVLHPVGEVGQRRRAEQQLEVAAGALFVQQAGPLVDTGAKRGVLGLRRLQIDPGLLDLCPRVLVSSLGGGDLHREGVEPCLEGAQRHPALVGLALHLVQSDPSVVDVVLQAVQRGLGPVELLARHRERTARDRGRHEHDDEHRRDAAQDRLGDTVSGGHLRR